MEYQERTFFDMLIFCRRQLLNSVQLVEPNMEELGLVTINHGLEENLVELTTLLMVYQEKLIPLIACQSNGGLRSGDCSMIHQCITRVTQEQIDGEVRHMGRNPGGVLKCKEKKSKFVSALQLLEVFGHAGDSLR